MAPVPDLPDLVPLVPAGARLPVAVDEPALAPLLDHPARGARRRSVPGAYVRGVMISSVDGAAWGGDHLSGSINGPADLRAFHVLRALADVVLVGAGTVRAEGYGPLACPDHLRGLRNAHGRAATLELAVVTRTGALPPALLDPRTDGPPPLVVTTSTGAEALADVVADDRLVVAGEDDVDLRTALGDLVARGLGRVAAEGGPHLLDALRAAEALDEICVTTSPLVVGAGPGRIVAGDAGPTPSGAAAHVALRTLLAADDGTLVARWVLTDPDAGPPSPGAELPRG